MDSGPRADGPTPEPSLELTTERIPLRNRLGVEHAFALTLGLLVLLVHDVSYLLGAPFWSDEAWVAVTTRFPWTRLPRVTSSTPIGWSVLLRLVTVRGHQTSRLLPLAFAGAAVVLAYWFGRGLGWRRSQTAVVAGALCAVAVLLVPAMLVRDDLKQYTADAASALLVLVMTSRLERDWSRRGLLALSVTIWGGMLFSHTVAFVGVAAFAGLSLVQLGQRSWSRLVEAAVAGVATGGLMLAVYAIFDARAVVPGLTVYWNGYYLPLHRGLGTARRFVTTHFDDVGRYFGLGPIWVAGPLFLAGLVTIWRLGRPATALTVVILWPAMLVASAAKKYPFLDLRTSTFLFAVTALVAALGVGGICASLRSRVKGLLSLALAVLATAAFVVHVHPFVDAHSITSEDVRDQAGYVAHHAASDDVILVNLNSNWGFAYYWPIGKPALRSDPAVLQGYVAYFPNQPRILVASGRTSVAVDSLLTAALARARRHPGSRIWLVRTHLTVGEQDAWNSAFTRFGLTPKPVGRHGLSVTVAP